MLSYNQEKKTDEISGARNEERKPIEFNPHSTYWRQEKLRESVRDLFNICVWMDVRTGIKILMVKS